MAERLEHEVTGKEIKEVLFSKDISKALGSNGFDVLFFKKAWNIFREDVINVINHFFQSGHFLNR